MATNNSYVCIECQNVSTIRVSGVRTKSTCYGECGGSYVTFVRQDYFEENYTADGEFDPAIARGGD